MYGSERIRKEYPGRQFRWMSRWMVWKRSVLSLNVTPHIFPLVSSLFPQSLPSLRFSLIFRNNSLFLSSIKSSSTVLCSCYCRSCLAAATAINHTSLARKSNPAKSVRRAAHQLPCSISPSCIKWLNEKTMRFVRLIHA